MKKLFVLCAISLLAFGAAFAQDAAADVEVVENYSDTSTRYIQIEDKYAEFHPTAKSVTLSLEYTPLTGEVVVYYRCMAASYDQGEAMNTIDAVLEDFRLQNKFTRKPVLVKKKDKVTYPKEGLIKMACHRRWVRFTD